MGKRLLGLSILALSLPAAASVGQLDAKRAAPREPMAAVEASPQPSQAKAVQFEAISQVLDGVTVMELEETGKHVRRVVLRPDFKNGPGAAFTVRF
ncbi:MAG: hypothetical protein E6J85_16775 [Deltaproteobacteria bacterium]|nr:MAG: hypothetical protein E6J85_16775 [Deltaproteobacteria bacterium]